MNNEHLDRKDVKPGLLDVPVSVRKSSDSSSRKAKKPCAGQGSSALIAIAVELLIVVIRKAGRLDTR
jgi:hypothetical protein